LRERQSSPSDVVPVTREPLVSIGVPVRNGAAFLEEALQLLVRQTHMHLEIIVSDNASDDGSGEIIESFARSDTRIRVYKQPRTLTAFENFRFVFEQSCGKYFMWAACDDRRSLDNVHQLLAALEARPDASLAFGDVAEFSDPTRWQTTAPIHYTFETTPTESWRDRLERNTRINCLHIYGLIRRSALASYSWIDIDNGPDIPLLVHLAFQGEFIRASSGCFFYYVPPCPKTLEERAIANSLSRLQRFPELRLSWACAKAAHRAGHLTGRTIGRLSAFALVYVNRHWSRLKPRLFEMAPLFAVAAYRRWFKRGHV
jgi:glycosyltransferase involved in cell wall biosynthesis